MAMSATISVSPSTAKVNQEVVATLTVSNSGGSAVNVTSIDPSAFQTSIGAAAKACSPVGYQTSLSGVAGPPIRVSVAASGSTIFVFSYKFFAPSTNSSTYDVGAVVTSDDGSVFSPTAATVTVSNPS